MVYNLGVISPYLTNKTECVWFVWISFSSLFLKIINESTLFVPQGYSVLPASFPSLPGSLSMQAFVLESKIKTGKNVYVPWVMKIRIQMSVGTQTDSSKYSVWAFPSSRSHIVSKTILCKMKLLRAEEDGLPQKVLSICVLLSLEMGVLDESRLLPASALQELCQLFWSLTLLPLFPVGKYKTWRHLV